MQKGAQVTKRDSPPSLDTRYPICYTELESYMQKYSHISFYENTYMIIEIESFYGDKWLTGKALSADELKSIVKDILKTSDEHSFVSVFCSRLGYTELSESDGYAAFVVDLDIHKIYSPSYTFPQKLSGANVLYYTDKSKFSPTVYSDGTIARNIAYLAICAYSKDTLYHVFHCDESFNIVADNRFPSIKACKNNMNKYTIIWHKRKDN